MRWVVVVMLVLAATPAHTLDSVRGDLIDKIWPDGYPVTQPTVRSVDAVPGLDVDGRVERLDFTVDGYRSHGYVIHPENPHGFAIVHAGHSDEIDGGIGETIEMLVGEGWSTAVLHMPFNGWNPDYERRGTGGHVDWFNTHPGLGAFRIFLEPVVQTLNAYGDAVMVGLSGGGWTTHLIAALDERVRVSVPVAGSLPLHLRTHTELGDPEQYHPGLYRETATWLQIYGLAVTDGRTQVQILNLYDPCCFSGTRYEVYSAGMPDGWSVWVDDTHREHQVSAAARQRILDVLVHAERSDS